MFHYIEGLVSELEPGLAVIDCGGVGYGLFCTLNTVSQLKLGAKARLYVAESIGENNFDLYGFYSKSEKRCFDMLLSVSGIGPKAALSILSSSTPEGLALAVINDDVKALTAAPGVGKKIAQRVILELKDKLGKELGDSVAPLSAGGSALREGGAVNDAMTGLSVLGYSSGEITGVIKNMDVTGLSAEQIIKAVLKQMVK